MSLLLLGAMSCQLSLLGGFVADHTAARDVADHAGVILGRWHAQAVSWGGALYVMAEIEQQMADM